MRVGENNGKDGQRTIILSVTEKKTSIELWYFFSMSDEGSRSACKQMWKIPSGVFIVYLLRIPLKKAI